MGDDGKKGGMLAQIVVGAVVGLAVAGTSPFWWVPVREFVFPPHHLIPANMVGVWTGTLTIDDGSGPTGSTPVLYTLFPDGDIKVDDCSYMLPPLLYHLKKQAVGETIPLELQLKGLGTHQAEIKLNSLGKLYVKVIGESGSKGVQRAGDLTPSHLLPTKETEKSQCRL